MSDRQTYIHGYSSPEHARLIEQARMLAPTVFTGLDLAPDRRLLEIGCGVGAQTRHLLNRWPRLTIDSIDLSEEQLAAAGDYLREDVDTGRVRLARMNAEELRFSDNLFDAVLTIWVLEHAPEPGRILREAWRVLRPGGRILLTEVDNATFRFYPHNPVVQQWWDAFNRFQQHGGADPFIGQRIAALADRTGFERIRTDPLHAISSRREPHRRLELLRYCRDLLLSGSWSLKRAGWVKEELEQKMRKEFETLESRLDVDFEYFAVRLTAFKPVDDRP